jgi:cysteinyl-tRNA synthetase
MVAIIGRLLRKGHAYVADGGEGREVLFAIDTMKAYGALSNRRLDEQKEGARVAVEAHKRNPGDFVLWKGSTADEPGWEAQFPTDEGPVTIFGRPGWHIECSAMSMAKLLEPYGGGLNCDDPTLNTFDIHGGGLDLIFPHHENEIAQSCCAFGIEKMASVWMHNGFVQVEGRKMSKSEGNFITIHDLLHTDKFGGRSWPGEVLRLAMLKTHYRQPIDWTERALEEAEATLKDWCTVAIFSEGNISEQVVMALQDDLNISEAIKHVHRLKKERQSEILGATLLFLGFDLRLMGQFMPPITGRLDISEIGADTASVIGTVAPLIAARNAARAAKDWPESDRIRAELDAMGIMVKDGKDADGNPVSTWEVKR